MLQDLCDCDPNTLSLFQLKVLEDLNYVRNINKQRPDFDAICKHISRSEASNIYKTTVANIINALNVFIFTKKATKLLQLLLKNYVMKLICLSQPATPLQHHSTFWKH